MTGIDTPIINDIIIKPNSKDQELVFDNFIAHGTSLCQYTWSYEAYLETDLLENSVLAQDVTFSPSDRKFMFTPTKDDYTYTITIKGSLSDNKTVE